SLLSYCRRDTCWSRYFCSSRRRHTRSKRDWSSDVCSSDLLVRDVDARSLQERDFVAVGQHLQNHVGRAAPFPVFAPVARKQAFRSAERRVGKGCTFARLEDHSVDKETINVKRGNVKNGRKE